MSKARIAGIVPENGDGVKTRLSPTLGDFLPRRGNPVLQMKAQFFLTDLSDDDSGNFMLVPGSPRVVARLDPDQAAQVIANHAVPPTLLGTLRERADAIGWTASTPYSGSPKPDEAVDPAAFFPTPSTPK